MNHYQRNHENVPCRMTPLRACLATPPGTPGRRKSAVCGVLNPQHITEYASDQRPGIHPFSTPINPHRTFQTGSQGFLRFLTMLVMPIPLKKYKPRPQGMSTRDSHLGGMQAIGYRPFYLLTSALRSPPASGYNTVREKQLRSY